MQRWHQVWWFVVSLALNFHHGVVAAQQTSPTIDWFDNYNEAVKEARRLKQPIFLEFRCAP